MFEKKLGLLKSFLAFLFVSFVVFTGYKFLLGQSYFTIFYAIQNSVGKDVYSGYLEYADFLVYIKYTAPIFLEKIRAFSKYLFVDITVLVLCLIFLLVCSFSLKKISFNKKIYSKYIFSGIKHKQVSVGLQFIIFLLPFVFMMCSKGFYPIKDFLIFNKLIAITQFSIFFKGLLAIFIILYIAIVMQNLHLYKIKDFEFYFFIFFSFVGSVIAISSYDFLSLFCGLELLNLSLYILAGIVKKSKLSLESSTKYLILGSVSTGIFLKGVSLIYFITGTTNYLFLDIFEVFLIFDFYQNINFIFFCSILLIALSFFFKMGVFPFHTWVADVYSGVPLPVTFFFATIVKFSVFIIFSCLLYVLGWPSLFGWEFLVFILGILTVAVGAFGAFQQFNIKRFLAYSSVNHAGFLLLFLMFYRSLYLSHGFLYLFIYIFTTMGIFLVISQCVGVKVHKVFSDGKLKFIRKLKSIESLTDLQVIYKFNPFLFLFVAFFFFSLGGIPPLAGFFPKYLLFTMLVDQGYLFGLFFLILLSTFSLGYYLRVLKLVYFDNLILNQNILLNGNKAYVNITYWVMTFKWELLVYVLAIFLVTGMKWLPNVYELLFSVSFSITHLDISSSLLYHIGKYRVTLGEIFSTFI